MYVFISYSSQNKKLAESFKILFNKNGIETWMAPGDIPIGSTYTSEINRAIKNSSAFVLLFSESAQKSQWVLRETERAVSAGKPIFTILLNDVEMNDDFEFMLRTSQLITLKKNDESKVKQLIESMKTILCLSENVKAPEKYVVDKNVFIQTLQLGHMLGRMEFLWDTKFNVLKEEEKKAFNDIKVRLDAENVPYNTTDFYQFITSILNYYGMNNAEKQYAILLGIFLQRLELSIATKEQELYDNALSKLKMIPSSFLKDKDHFVDKMEDAFKKKTELIDIMHMVYSYIG